METTQPLPLDDVEFAIGLIVEMNEEIRRDWSDGGWAPPDAARLLTKARLDRQVSLSYALYNWLDEPAEEEAEGQLILAWATLGTLVEGSMKWILCVHEGSYAHHRVKTPAGHELAPDRLRFAELCRFFAAHFWTPGWDQGRWVAWCDMVRRRRNAIHAYHDRDLGTFAEFHRAVDDYVDFLVNLRMTVPDRPTWDQPRWQE